MVKPLTKPKIVKKRTKPFKRHQCDRKICVKVTLCPAASKRLFGWHETTSLTILLIGDRNHGDALKVLTQESEESSRGLALLCQTSVMAQTRRPDICYPTVRIVLKDRSSDRQKLSRTIQPCI